MCFVRPCAKIKERESGSMTIGLILFSCANCPEECVALRLAGITSSLIIILDFFPPSLCAHFLVATYFSAHLQSYNMLASSLVQKHTTLVWVVPEGSLLKLVNVVHKFGDP